MNKFDMDLDLSKMIQTPLKKEQIMSGTYDKSQIVLHHTVSGDFPRNVASWWNRTKTRVATALLIGHDGRGYQCFSSKKWAHHIGVKSDFLKDQGFIDYKTRNVLLNKHSIGVEICNWGGLKYKNGKWYNSYDKVVDTEVVEYPNKFRGYYGFEKYTQKQIEKVLQLCYYWYKVYGIPMHYNDTMWDVSKEALGGKSGIWSHTSYRTDKSDCHPQIELIEGLKYLEEFVYGTSNTNSSNLTGVEITSLDLNLAKMQGILDSMEDIIQDKGNDKWVNHYSKLIRDLSILLQ